MNFPEGFLWGTVPAVYQNLSMEHRELGGTGMQVTAISLRTWARGDGWGEASDEDVYATLNEVMDLDVNLRGPGAFRTL